MYKSRPTFVAQFYYSIFAYYKQEGSPKEMYIPYFLKQYPGELNFLTSSDGETIGRFKNLCSDFDHI